MYLNDLTDEVRKILPFKILRTVFIFVAIISIVSPIYKLNVQLPRFSSLSQFSGSIEQFELTDGIDSEYKIQVNNSSYTLTFRLSTEYMNKELYSHLDNGGYIKVWIKRDWMLEINV